jgi:hypothetical protein
VRCADAGRLNKLIVMALSLHRDRVAQGKTMMPPMLNELALAHGFATLQRSLVCSFTGEFHV